MNDESDISAARYEGYIFVIICYALNILGTVVERHLFHTINSNLSIILTSNIKKY